VGYVRHTSPNLPPFVTLIRETVGMS
jgi:hypothetical protein